jgi:HAD superfamily hydrolase (TIGR01509 family)
MPALIFDCDGVLADTERYGHLPAFNATFEHFGLPVRWTEEEYGEKLRIGGGKERMATLFEDPELVGSAGLPTEQHAQADLLAEWHRYKTDLYTEMVQAGRLPGRPGVARLVEEADAAGWALAVASTSAEPSVLAVLRHVVGADRAKGFVVAAGDVVSRKKPDPEIYHLVLQKLGIGPEEAIVIEDSRNGLVAAHAAGLPCLVTVNGYTEAEDMSEARLVVSDLGNPGRPIRVLANRCGAEPGEIVTLADLKACMGAVVR